MRFLIAALTGLLMGALVYQAVNPPHPVRSLVLVGIAVLVGLVGQWIWDQV